ncbi:MAG: hypothetical protein JNM10_10635 [Planctomycetia bacterium]|nr:hypothetical protein [Planctomycetia bacterium]
MRRVAACVGGVTLVGCACVEPRGCATTAPVAERTGERADVAATTDVPPVAGRSVRWVAPRADGAAAAASLAPTFEVAFHDRDGPLRFATGREVRAFGVDGGDRGRDATVRAAQVVVFLSPDGPPDPADPTLVVSLRPRAGDPVVVLARGGRATTLEAAWRRARAFVEHGTPMPLRPGTTHLWIPRLTIPASPVRPAADVPAAPPSPSAAAHAPRLRLDGRGVRAATRENLVASWRPPMAFAFDEPFLVAVLGPDGAPTLLAWVGDDAWLDPWPPLEPLSDAWRQRLAGRWVLDVDATARARARVILTIAGSFPDAATPEARAAYARDLQTFTDTERQRLAADAHGAIVTGDELALTTPRGHEVRRLALRDGAVVASTRPDGADVWPVRLDGGLLSVGLQLVFRRP